MLKKIKIIELGGTISAQGRDRLDLKDYVSGQYKGKDFLQVLPELESAASVTFETFTAVSSTAMKPAHWLGLRKKVIDTLGKENFDGVVLTHGTSTLEETAYFLHLTIPNEKPVILTGAQKPFTAVGTDAHLNLFHAVNIAANNDAIGKGVLVVLNETIHSAREVTKTDTYRQETFQSGHFGCLGVIDPNADIEFYREPTRIHTLASEFSNESMTSLPDVAIIYSYAGANGDIIRLLNRTKKTAGLVVAGMGAGLASPEQKEALEEAKSKGMMIVSSSRVGNGRVLPLQHHTKSGFLTADNLQPQKARILLMLALTKYHEIMDIQRLFDTY